MSWHYYKLYNVNFNKLPTELKKHTDYHYENTAVVSRFPNPYKTIPTGNWSVSLRSEKELDIDLIKKYCQKLVYREYYKTWNKCVTYTKVHGYWKEREGY